ncbi:MAG: NAD(P)H-hydrate dehydratase [Sphingomonas bacterium]|uniref:NAD(P)H-hydrate dehydratase n=1 Tax=Sphingomonas bacterium TaxID=1895847 RepID=UPI002619F905|nr:NAD(P)H-hydrate dehydratase [Sphingomonas bacterium]MDB5695626.1 NAD(P)H-hydrate dehydratase [Sphingomonas bacterium]
MLPIDGQPILTAAQMRAAEERAAPTPEAMYALMERAGAGVADAVRRLATGAEVLVLCGPGNNGGDGFVAARMLAEAGHPVRVATTGKPVSDLARLARQGWTGPSEDLVTAGPATVVVDALFGTGLSRPLDGKISEALHRLVRAAHLGIAVDLPSGLATDSGAYRTDPPTFDITLALGALKPAHVLFPAADRCGAVRILTLGFEVASDLTVLTRPAFLSPGWDAHKFRALVAVIAGVMPGAGALAATAAARAGAGYVLCLGGATDRVPHALVRRRWAADALADERIDAILIGPGLGRDDTAHEKLAAALASHHPLVLDGDALALVTPAQLAARRATTILTPHGGEFHRLFGPGDGSRVDRARAAAKASDATVVLKGADTVIARPDGVTLVAPAGPSWLATAGTGDVLAGVVAARLAVGALPDRAAAEAVWLHAEAARRAGPAFIADDLAQLLPAAIAACR